MKKEEVVEKNETLNQEENEQNKELDEKDELIKSLEETIKELTQEIEVVKRGAADIINRNKQMEIEKKYASVSLISKLLTPLSYFEGALKIQTQDENIKNFLKGFDMIYNLLFDQLYSDGLKEIAVDLGETFNPRFHDVTELVEVTDEESDKILEIVQKGYMFKDRVIQPVKVKVSKKIKVDENNNKEETE